MACDTILYISDPATSSKPILAALEATGYAVVSTSRSTQAIALLFVMHSAAAVVLDQRRGEEANFNLIRNLRSICPDVPILLLCHDQIHCTPPDVDACVSLGQPFEDLTLDDLTLEVRRLLTAMQVAVETVPRGQRYVNADHVSGD
jgi:DNA-binding NtrC family response regulator